MIEEPVRISKILAERGVCSRREADALLARGLVFVDGAPAEVGEKALPSQSITIAEAGHAAMAARATVLLHKPLGFVSGQAEDGYTPAIALIRPQNEHRPPVAPSGWSPGLMDGLAPAGRLDIDSTGLLVLTQSGVVARQLIGAETKVEKEYLVRVHGELSAEGLAMLNHGLSLDGRQLRPAKVRWQRDGQLQFILREGRKRQIRRMCELVGLRVVALKRVRIGRVLLADLPPGKWRLLRADERF